MRMVTRLFGGCGCCCCGVTISVISVEPTRECASHPRPPLCCAHAGIDGLKLEGAAGGIPCDEQTRIICWPLGRLSGDGETGATSAVVELASGERETAESCSQLPLGPLGEILRWCSAGSASSRMGSNGCTSWVEAAQRGVPAVGGEAGM